MGRRIRFSPEVKERAVRMVLEQEPEHDSQWSAMRSTASKIGCSPESLRRWWLVAVALTIVVGTWVVFRVNTGVTYEDSLITYRISANLSNGEGLVFNPGERVQGSTTPLLTLVLGLGGWLFGAGSIPIISVIVGVLSCVGALLFSALAFGRLGFPPWSSALLVAVVGLQANVILAAVAGMETGLVLLWMAMGFFGLVANIRWLAIVSAGALVLTRLDGVIWASLVTALLIPKARRSDLRAAVPVAMATLGWFTFAWLYFGSPIPHSIVAKRVINSGPEPWSWEGVVGGAWWFWDVLALSSGAFAISGWIVFWLAALAIGAARAVGLSHRRKLLLLLFFVPLLFFAYWVGRAPRAFSWYVTPAIWCVALIGVAGVADLTKELWRRGEAVGWRQRSVRPIALLILVLTVLPIGWQLPGLFRLSTIWQTNEDGMRRVVGEWLAAEAEPGERVAMEPIGYQAYYSGLPVIDLAGLVSPEVVRIAQNYSSNGERFRVIWESLEPDWIVLRTSEVDQNWHFHGGKLFEAPVDREAFFAAYTERRTFEAPYPEHWGRGSRTTIYQRKKDQETSEGQEMEH